MSLLIRRERRRNRNDRYEDKRDQMTETRTQLDN